MLADWESRLQPPGPRDFKLIYIPAARLRARFALLEHASLYVQRAAAGELFRGVMSALRASRAERAVVDRCRRAADDMALVRCVLSAV